MRRLMERPCSLIRGLVAVFATLGLLALAGCNGFFINATTSTALTASATSVTSGMAITLTATVKSSAATGTVTFYDGTTELGTGTVSSGVATYSVNAPSVGTHSYTADYGGDDTYNPSNSAAVSVVVSSTMGNTTTTLSASPTSAVSGAPVTLTATVSSSTATGTVTFYNGTTSLGTGTLSNGAATLAVTILPAGNDSVTAQYGGDTSNAGSTSTAVMVTITAAASGRLEAPHMRATRAVPVLG